MKIGVIGVGMVGNAVLQFFHGREDVFGYDIHKPDYSSNREKLKECDLIFVCVPTPTDDDGQDLSAVRQTLALLKTLDVGAEVVLKSTVLPGTCRSLWAEFGIDVIHNPEFLTERNAVEDFAAQEQIIIGVDVVHDHKVIKLYSKHFPDAYIEEMTTVTAEMYKYAHNCFLATKVTFWNEMFFAASRAKANFETIRDCLVHSGKAGDTHNSVPGPDGKYGFGGACFPKDTQAFAKWFGNGLISSVVQTNKKHRG
jgi:nucleotide sugar dehydrogenase